MLDTTFGYLTKQGYCVQKGQDKDCQRFPVSQPQGAAAAQRSVLCGSCPMALALCC